MDALIHILVGLVLSILINLRFHLSRRTVFLFALGSVLPDFGHLVSFIMTTPFDVYPQLLFHNIFFILFIALFRNLPLLCGVSLHIFLDLFAYNPWELLYPVIDVKVGFGPLLASSVVDTTIIIVFIFSLIFGKRFLWKKRNKADLLRFGLMFTGSLIFLFGNVSVIGVVLVLAGFFIDDEYMRSVYYASVIYFCGIDGSGKSTHAEETVKVFRDKGLKIVTEHFFKNPLVTPLSKIKNKTKISKREETLTYTPQFERHVRRHLLPKFRAYLIFLDNLIYIGSKLLWHKLKGEWIIADRFFFDYFLRLKLLGYKVRGLERIYRRLFPKYGVVFDVAPDIAFKRREEHPPWYYVKARKEYLEISSRFNYPVLRTDKPFDEVQVELKRHLDNWIVKRRTSEKVS